MVLLFSEKTCTFERFKHDHKRIAGHAGLQLLFGTIKSRIGDRMSTKTLGHDFDENGLGILLHFFQDMSKTCIAIEKVHPVESVPLHSVTGGFLLCNWLNTDGSCHMCSHPPQIIFDDVDTREVPKRSEIERFMKSSLCNSTIAKKANGNLTRILMLEFGNRFAIFDRKGSSRSNGNLTAYNAKPAQKPFCEKVHGSATSFCIACRSSKKLCKQLIGRGSEQQS